MSIMSEFREFAVKGSVVDLAVGVIIGAAFGGVVTSLVNDVVMPPIGRLLGGVDFKDFFVSLSGQSFPTLAAAKAAGAPTLNYGLFLNTVINFIIVAFAVFLVIREMNKANSRVYGPPPAAGTTKECPHCASVISIKARRCPHCTSELQAA